MTQSPCSRDNAVRGYGGVEVALGVLLVEPISVVVVEDKPCVVDVETTGTISVVPEALVRRAISESASAKAWET